MMESVILKNLATNETYARKVHPFLKEEYFSGNANKKIFNLISDFITKYNSLPTREAVDISLSKLDLVSEDEYTECSKCIESIFTETDLTDINWLVEQTENHVKDKAVYNAIMDSIHILDGKSKTHTKNAIPTILSNALSVSFDNHIGHDYIDDAERRFQFYHQVEKRIPFDLEFFNAITGGGVPAKTLNIVMAGTGVGKSLFLCHHAANCLVQNLNVLYITCEMAEERIAERIDANLLDITLDSLKELPKTVYDKKMEALKSKIHGKLIVKEYPTASASVANFKHLLDELKIKKRFIPDVIFVDYINICASARIKQNANTNSYFYIKSVAEELRGLAVEYNVPIFSATQVNRSGFANSDFGLEDTSESFGLPATADFFCALISTEDLENLGQILVKQLKNRYNSATVNKKFVVGIDRSKMKLFDVKRDDQDGISDSNQNDPHGYGNGYSPRQIPNLVKVNDWKIE